MRLPVYVALAVATVLCSAAKVPTQEKDPQYWNSVAQKAIQDSLQMKHNNNVARNVIFFLGDGMSIPTLAASRILKGQLNGQPGEEAQLVFEKFPHVGLVKTYNVDRQVSDSAATATAFLCGVKANYETVGLDAGAQFNVCSSEAGHKVSSIMSWAQAEGKATGLVTTTRVTHATPAGAYAHSVNRYWEYDEIMTDEDTACKDIARQLIEDPPGHDLNVIFGGGRSYFAPINTIDKGMRKDGRYLINEWIEDKRNRKVRFRYISRLSELRQLQNVDYVLGLFSNSHLDYEKDRQTDPSDSSSQPSVAEMTKKAIEILSQNPKGFVLLVEGGRIDHAHHDGAARKALEETLAMEEAVKVALDMTNQEDTLIVVTADHAHVMTFNGYPVRGNDIFGFADVSDVDHLPFTTLMYTNGPGFNYTENGTRYNLTETDTAHRDYLQLAAVPHIMETHGGEDVAVFAIGPMAHLFHGIQEQNYIAHVMAYATCIGINKDHCLNKTNSAATFTISLNALMVLIFVIIRLQS